MKKILSLTEPYATLIKEKKKLVETRSWKTDYRGELYIHASMTKVSKKDLEDNELMSLVENKEMNFGYIICKCNLLDCIYMTEEYVEDIKKNNHQEYICGEYEIGRYAWTLEDITLLEKTIKVKGQLNIWTFYDEYEIMEMMNDIKYGWVDEDKIKHEVVDQTFANNYRLLCPHDTMKYKMGICWDQVELERYYFKAYDSIKTYFIVHYDGKNCPTHTFLTFEKDNKYYWFEHSWEIFRGIHEYSSRKKLLLDVRDKFIKYELNNDYDISKVCLHEYKKPKYQLAVEEFFNHCDEGPYIDLDNDL